MLIISSEKLFLFSKCLNFCLEFLVMQKNGSMRKIKLISRLMTSQPGKQTIPMHILTNVSRSKSNQGMKFGRLIKYECGLFFLNNHTQNVLNKLFPDPFLENQNWAYLWVNSLKRYAVCFYCMPNWGLSKYIETKLQNFCFYLFKKKWGLELVFLLHFLPAL